MLSPPLLKLALTQTIDYLSAETNIPAELSTKVSRKPA
jgi:hypothetical protein